VFKITDRLHGRQPGWAHRCLQPSVVSQPDLCAQHHLDRLGRAGMAAVDLASTSSKASSAPGIFRSAS
jgi:hypothetical protein